jgi:hypothetical protein
MRALKLLYPAAQRGALLLSECAAAVDRVGDVEVSNGRNHYFWCGKQQTRSNENICGQHKTQKENK